MSEVIILDTHIWLWLIHGNFDRFPQHWLQEIQTSSMVGVSAVSCYEIALAVKRGRITLSKDLSTWFSSALGLAGISLIPINEQISIQAVELSPVHKDPFDRLIIATALVHQARLASVDGLFQNYPELSNVLMQ